VGSQILLDSTVLIAGLSESDKRFKEAREIFTENSRATLAISSISVTETLVRPFALGPIQGERVASAIHALVGSVISFEKEHAILASKIRATMKARTFDSMIIATALISNLQLVTFDRKMMGVYERSK
jgi:predicted nucleic acid-binding protein